MKFLRRIIACIAFMAMPFMVEAPGQEEALPGRTLIVGVKEAPPFAMKADDGSWGGISIDLWNHIAGDLNLSHEFRELDLRGLIEGIANGSLDAAVAALTITPEREEAVDFTHPFYTTGLGMAVTSKAGNPWLVVLKRFFSLDFMKVMLTIFVMLIAVGLFVWVFERKRNPRQFGGGTARGLGAGFWWSAVTMTTVGYGDKAPITLGGRIVALLWMFAGIIMVSSFTAAVAAVLTVSQLDSPVQGAEDLPQVTVGTVPGSTSASYLRKRGISFQPCGTPLEGLQALWEQKIDVLVYDAPLLRYLIHQRFQGKLEVLPNKILRQDYGIALPGESPLREPINRVLLQKINEPWWQELLLRYLGE